MTALRVLALWIVTAFRAAPAMATFLSLNAAAAAVLGPLVSLGVAHTVGAVADGQSLWPPLVATAAVLAVSALLAAVAPPLGDTADERIRLHVRRDLAQLVSGIPSLAHHEDPAVADRIDLVSRDSHTLAGIYRAMSTVGAVAGTVTVAGLLASVSPWLMLLLPIAVVATGVEAYGIHRRQQLWRSHQKYRRLGTRVVEVLSDPPSGVEVRCFGLLDPLARVASRAFNDRLTVVVQATRRTSIAASACWLLVGVSYLVGINWLFGEYRAGRASLAGVTLLLMILGQLTMTAKVIALNVNMVIGALDAYGRYEWLRRYASTHTWAESTARPPTRLTEGITFADVTFRYPSDDGEQRDASLDGVNLHLPAGTTVALVGDNGAGKSTVVKLLARLYDPTSGEVLVDGVPLRDIDPIAWRERVSAGFQDFARLEFLAADSIGVGDLEHRTDRAVITGAAEAGQASPVIAGLPQGLDSQLGQRFESGVNLSGGQWQRLALARAFMRPAPLLMLLDEPTAALDPEAEQAIYEQYAATGRTLARETGAVTVLVSHRFSTVRMADLIVVMGDGHVTELGTHAELLRRGGRYAELFTLQSDAYR